jgi:hypothetical protein
MGVWILFYEAEGDGSLDVVFRGGGEKGRGADGAGFSPLTTTRLRVARSWAKRTQSAGYVTYAGVRFVRRVVRVLRARERPRAGVASSTRVARVFYFKTISRKVTATRYAHLAVSFRIATTRVFFVYRCYSSTVAARRR